MASISTDSSGNRRIQFVDGDGGRKSIYLGKLAMKATLAIKAKVEAVLSATTAKVSIDTETSRWIESLDDTLADKLAAVELIPKRERQSIKVFLDDYVKRRSDVKPATRQIWRFVINDLCEFFGNDRPIIKISEAEALDFKQSLIDRKLSAATVAKRLQQVRSFFHDARRRKLIPANPFAEVSAKSVIKLDKRRFVTRDEAIKLLDACPNFTWRTIVGLARFGGLRCPSEVLSLRWQDIDWDKRRMVVQSPKTECHGKGTRVIPLFPELSTILTDAFEQSPEGAMFVVDPKYQRSSKGINGWRNCNLRTTFEKIIRRAGLEPWPKLFHSLRSSRETELAADYPIHVVTAWLGNTPTIALRHYLLTTDADFDRAAAGNETTHNPTQQLAGMARRESHAENENCEIPAENELLQDCANVENWGTRIRT